MNLFRSRVAALAAAQVLISQIVMAQGAGYATVSLSTSQIYESNLFAVDRSRAPESDLIVTIGPAFEAGYMSQPLKLTARYGLDAARYADHVSLSRSLARQEAVIALQHRPTRRLRLDLTTSYLRTRTPYELNLESALRVGHALAERRFARSAATYEWSPTGRLHLGYAVSLTALEGAADGQVHEAHVAIERYSAERGGRRIEYRAWRFGFDGSRPETSHVVAAGWSWNLSRRTSLEFSAGPRLSEGSVHPEIATAVRRQFQRGEVSLAYARTQATAIGETGAVDVQRVSTALTYRPMRLVTLKSAPTVAVSMQAGARVSVYTLDVEAAAGPRRGLSMVITGRVGVQQGTFAGGNEVIPYRTFAVALRATFPRTPAATRSGRVL